MATTPATASARPNLWMHGPLVDGLLGWCFLPIAVVVHYTEPHLTQVQALVGIIFLISFAHQPLTLGLVYGDPAQREAHRRLYTWAPLCAAALIMLGLSISLGLVAIMAGLWNAEHTLMQRYGVLRIYGRKAGDDNGRLEKPMFIAWLVTAVASHRRVRRTDDLVLNWASTNNTRGVTPSTMLRTRRRCCSGWAPWPASCSRLAGGARSGRSAGPARPSTSTRSARSASWWP
jgi:hypothetical protein